MKEKIDFLFWKRTWFRLFFVIFPIAPVLFSAFFVFTLGITDIDVVKSLFGGAFVVLFLGGMADNNNMDGCDKKLTWSKNESE